MERARLRPVWVLLLLLPWGALGPEAGAQPAPEPAPWPPAPVEVDDARGVAGRLDDARRAATAGRPDEALDRLVALREAEGEALVPLPGADGGPTPLYASLTRAVERLVLELPEAQRRRARARWAPGARVLLARARAGEEAALRQLAEDWPLTVEGHRALRTLARRDLEAGRFASAAARLERWLDLSGHLERTARARELVALADARFGLRDEAGLAALLDRHGDLARVAVDTARGRTTPALRARGHRARLREDATAPAAAMPAPSPLPEDPVVLWTRAYASPEAPRGAPPGAVPPPVVFAGAAVDGEALWLHDGRVVRRLDLWTGRVRWRFPPPLPAAEDVPPEHRYPTWAIPLRTVTLTDALALVVLGDPVAAGSFVRRGQEVQVDREARQTRTRLVALDRETGRLRWTTGRPTDAHPVLADMATGCVSSPLVVGDDVYALFARQRGVVELYAARLDLTTGAVGWVTFLATGESGRDAAAPFGAGRFVQERVRAAPWGARPALEDGELCVVPHAGFAAGLDARTGRVRWLRVLPRYDARFPLDASQGFGGRNETLAVAGAWVIAPHDAPLLVALGQGTGRWLWSAPQASAASELPAWRHLYGVRAEPEGGPWLGLVGDGPALLPLGRPGVPPLVGAPWADGGGFPRGRPADAGQHVVWAAPHPPDDPWLPGDAVVPGRPALHATPWAGAGASRRAVLEPGTVPAQGDVLRAGDVWLVLGAERLGAVTSIARAEAWSEQRARDPEASAGDRAAAAALGSRLALDGRGAARALRAAAASGDGGAIDVAVEAARAIVPRQTADAAPLLTALVEAAPARGAPALAAGLGGPGVSSEPLDLVGWLDRWLAVPSTALVEAEPGVHLRADLYAARLLRSLRLNPAAAEAVAERDARHAKAVERAAAEGEPALREAIRRAAATPAAGRGREDLRSRLVAERRHAEAAGVSADLRLSGLGEHEGARTAARRARLAALQVEEAAFAARGGQPERARRLLADLARWADDRMGLRGPDGEPADRLRRRLERATAWRPRSGPVERLDVWAGHEGAVRAPEIRSVVFPGLRGPGAARAAPDRLLLCRGLGAEIWSREAGRRVVSFPDRGEGWFGGTLQGVAPWVPGGGVLVTSLMAREPADRQGLRAGDWVVAWDGTAIESAAHFMHLAARSRPDVPIPVEVRRRGRPVLGRFVPGRRPTSEGVVVRRETLYASETGEVLLPGRLDVAWVDVARARRRVLWAWEERGVVAGADRLGGHVVVTIRRLGEADAVVAVDPETGRERWRRDVAGAVVAVEATGSALVLTTTEPHRAVVLDARDGSVRFRIDVLARRVASRPRSFVPAPVAVTSHGRLWWLADAEYGFLLGAINTTTGVVEWRERLADSFLPPLLAADGVLALVPEPGRLELLAPDPMTGRVAWRAVRSEERVGAGQASDWDTRVLLSGGTVWTIRTGAGFRIRVEALHLQPTALGPRTAPGEVAAADATRLVTSQRLGAQLDARPYVFDARATPEGLVLSGGSAGDRGRRLVAWVGVGGRTRTWEDAVRSEEGVLQVRRHPPARVGSTLVLPTDVGAQLVPIDSVSAR